MVVHDLLHCVDKGVAAHWVGSVMVELTYYELQGTPMENFKQIAGLIEDAYKELNCISNRISNMQFNMMGPLPHTTNYPVFEAKAVETRYLVPALYLVCKNFNRTDAHHLRRTACGKYLCRFYEIIDTEGIKLSTEAFQELRLCVKRFL
eukprot:7797732-Karenia_brevis.AAC.1